MKSNSTFRTPKPLSFTVFVTLLATALFFVVSCSKNDNQANPPALVMAANTAQGSAAQDFYVDNNKQNTSALAYGQSTNYFSVTAGDTHQSQFKASSTSTVDATYSLQLAPGGYYSVYFADNNTVTAYQNDRTPPQSGAARIRFINLSAALTSNVDFASSTGATVVSGLASRAASSYYDIATLSSSFSLKASGSSSVLLNIPVVLQAGKIYSIIVSGTTSATLTYSVIAEN